VLDGPESLSTQGLDIIFFKTSSPTVGSTQPSVRCILGFIPWGESVRFELYPLTSLQTHFYLLWVPYSVLSDNGYLYLYLYLQYFDDTHRVNGKRASFIHATDIDLRERSTVSVATKLWTGGPRFDSR